MNEERKPVLIVGAGPVGLLIANGLAANNVPFEIVDRKPGPSTESKGLAVNISSRIAFELCGLTDTIGGHGCKIKRLDVHWNGHRFSSINFTYLATDKNYLITQPQWVTEHELIGALEKRGCLVRWSHELVELEQLDGGVATQLKTQGDNLSEQYEYVIGCDGKYSKVRSYIEPNSETSQYNMYFALGDFQLEKHIPRDTVQYQVFGDGFYILVPISDELTRVVVKYNGTPPDRPIRNEDIIDYVNHYSGTTLINRAPDWISRAPFYNSVSDKMQNGQLFIAGDAAHLFSPIGGTGMNTGFQDAINLLWRLVYVYHGHADRSLLDYYETERVPANRSGMIAADTNTKNISDVNNAEEFIHTIAPTMSNRSNLRSTLPAAISGFAYALDHIDGFAGKTGQYDTALCDYILRHETDRIQPRQFRHTLLIHNPGLDKDYLNNVVERCQSYGFVNVLIVDPDAKSSVHHRRYTNTPQGSVGSTVRNRFQNMFTLVRPDGVIQLECDYSDVNLIFKYLNENFTTKCEQLAMKDQSITDQPVLAQH